MAAYDKHHSLPRFLQAGRTSAPDGTLCKYFWERDGQLKCKRRSSVMVGRQEGLYRLRGDPDKNVIERDFFGKQIDDPGAKAHHAIVANGILGLTNEQADAWANFVGMLMVRYPDAAAKNRELGRSVVRQLLEAQPPNIEVKNLPSGISLIDYVMVQYSHLVDDIAIRSLPILAESSAFIQRIRDATWALLELPNDTDGFLLGDRPVIYSGTMDSEILLALPLTPAKLFLALTDERVGKVLADFPPELLIEFTNLQTVLQAKEFVIGRDDQQTDFVRSHLVPSTRDP